MKVLHEHTDFWGKTLKISEHSNAIINVYVEQGYNFIVRKLFSQPLLHDGFPITQKHYDLLVETIKNTRYALALPTTEVTA